MTNSYGWHVIYVKSRHEKKVHEELERKGIESFLPLVATERQWSDRIKIVHTPLFPGYVFVNIKSAFDFHNVLTVESVHAYIRFGNEYGRVTKKEMTQMRLLVEGTNIEDIELNAELPNVGDRLKIEQGELSGLECEVYRIDNKNKVSVWINSINQNISATIPSDYFQKNVPNFLQL
jgi:transcription antitermination factor NusG